MAVFGKPPAPAEEMEPTAKVATPDTPTIEALAEFLDIPQSRTAKAVFMVATVAGDEGSAAGEEPQSVDRFVLAVIRGDMEINETKLANAVQARDLRPAREEEIAAVGAEPGYGSPIGVRDALVVADDSVPASPNLVAGANEAGYHLKNVNCGRDYQPDLVGDIAAAQEGDACPDCGTPLETSRGVEVGNIFQLGTRYSDAMGCTFLDAAGRERPVIMGSYGIGVGRLLACVAEEHHDEQGLIWPLSLAPFQVHLVALAKGPGQTVEAAEGLGERLGAAGVEVLLDDRNENAGVKFNDADLIGLPVRLTVGDRSLKQGLVEMKLRSRADRVDVPLEGAVPAVQAALAELQQELAARLVQVNYKE